MRAALTRSSGDDRREPASLAAATDSIVGYLRQGPTGLLLDFDGTLASIVSRPERALCRPSVRSSLAQLAARLRVVGVVSGREVNDLAERVPLPGIWLVGSHGAVIRRPVGAETRVTVPTYVRDALASLAIDLTDLPGVRLERKGTAIAFHYRGYEQDTHLVATLHARISAATKAAGLAFGEGRCVVEARAPGIDKGAALNRIVEEMDLRTVVVAGDDWTDLDAFRAAHAHPTCRGIAIAINSPEVPAPLREEADVVAEGVEELGEWLRELADLQ